MNLVAEIERQLKLKPEVTSVGLPYVVLKGEDVLRELKGHPDQHFGHRTYAQHGDDLMLLNLFDLIGIEKPSYLDLGAHDPFIISNTALLYARGSRGVNVEANPYLHQKFVEHRPEDKNLNVGVGTLPGTATFYQYSETSGRNTFSMEEVKSLEGKMKVVCETVLPVRTLKQIVMEDCGSRYPDLLSCDIEGLDFQVLSTLPKLQPAMPPWALPKVICVETRRHETVSMQRMLGEKGFQLHCRMGENLFFVRLDYVKLLF